MDGKRESERGKLISSVCFGIPKNTYLQPFNLFKPTTKQDLYRCACDSDMMHKHLASCTIFSPFRLWNYRNEAFEFGPRD